MLRKISILILTSAILVSCDWNSPSSSDNNDPNNPNNKPPCAPEALQAQAVSETAIVLTWHDMSDDEDGFDIHERIGSEGEFNLLIRTASNIDSLLLDRKSVLTDYYYRIRTFNIHGCSDFTEIARASTREVPPTAPTELQARSDSETDVSLSWRDMSAIETDFQVFESADDTLDFQQVATTPANRTSISIGDRQPLMTYFYRIRTVNGFGESEYCAVAWTTVGTIPPKAPSNLQVGALSDTEIILNWQDQSLVEERFEIHESIGDSLDFHHVDQTVANETEKTLTGRKGNTTYYYKLRAVNHHGMSDFSNIEEVFTPGFPMAPANLEAHAVSETEIQLNWEDNDIYEESFEIYESIGDSLTPCWLMTVGANETSLTLTERMSNRTYYYKILAANRYGQSGFTNIARASTAEIPPTAPERLYAQARYETVIYLEWADNSAIEDGYEIHESLCDSLHFKLLMIAEPNTSLQILNDRLADTTYYYRVRAVNGYGQSDFTNSARASTAELPPTEPTDLVAKTISDTEISLSWLCESLLADSFEIYQSESDVLHYNLIAKIPADNNFLKVTELHQATTYYYRMRALNQYGYSFYSNTTFSTTHINGILAFVADGVREKLQIFDVTDPNIPRYLGSIDLPLHTTDVAVSGYNAYVADGVEGIFILDISIPSEPRVISNYDTPGYAHAVELSGDIAYIADGVEGLHAIDVSDPANPKQVASYDTRGDAVDITLEGQYLYLADWDGIQIFDISNQGIIQPLGYCETPGFAFNVDVEGSIACVADFEGGFSFEGGLRVVDISDPADPRIIGSYNRGNEADYSVRAVSISNGFVYCVVDEVGLHAINISNPARPAPEGSVRFNGQAFDLVLYGNYAYVVGWGGVGLQTIDISRDGYPRSVGVNYRTTDGKGITVVEY